jgi:hypothetical protein
MRISKVIIAVMVSVLATFAVGVGTAAASGDGMPFDGPVLGHQ